jgi:hypothetical protein
MRSSPDLKEQGFGVEHDLSYVYNKETILLMSRSGKLCIGNLAKRENNTRDLACIAGPGGFDILIGPDSFDLKLAKLTFK